ncbi:MAG: DUF3127 domain-containing protein [Cryomorphaceae bacterium]|nr:DUF3127 domain-containing protein [Cryomorphaceae bacterium]
MQISGTVKGVNEVQQISNALKKRVLIVTTNEKYPQILAVEFINDKVSILDGFAVGEQVEVDVNIRGREWADPSSGEIKYFTSLSGWRICKVHAQATAQDQPF